MQYDSYSFYVVFILVNDYRDGDGDVAMVLTGQMSICETDLIEDWSVGLVCWIGLSRATPAKVVFRIERMIVKCSGCAERM